MPKKDKAKSPKKFADPVNTHRIARLCKSKGSEVRVQIMEYPDREIVDLRRFYKTDKMEKFAPTPKGLTVPLEDLPALYKAVRKAYKVAKREGLIEEED